MVGGNGITASITITIVMRNINATNYLSDCFPCFSFFIYLKIQTNRTNVVNFKFNKERRNSISTIPNLQRILLKRQIKYQSTFMPA